MLFGILQGLSEWGQRELEEAGSNLLRMGGSRLIKLFRFDPTAPLPPEVHHHDAFALRDYLSSVGSGKIVIVGDVVWELIEQGCKVRVPDLLFDFRRLVHECKLVAIHGTDPPPSALHQRLLVI